MRQILIRPVDFIHAVYLVANLMLIAWFYERLPLWKTATLGYLACALIQFLLIYLSPAEGNTPGRRLLKFLRDWYPCILIAYYYPALGNLSTVLYAHNFDSVLIGWERALFSADLSLLFYKAAPHIFIYELMHFFYFTFYVFAFFVGGFLYRLPDRDIFYRFIFVLMTMIAIQFYVFILLPTAGPKYAFAELGGQHLPARGLFSSIMHSMLVNGEIPIGAFPSSHVSVVMVCCMFASRYLGRGFYWLWAIFVGLVVSTVYLQQHYAIDALGGIAVAYIFYKLGNRVYNLAATFPRGSTLQPQESRSRS